MVTLDFNNMKNNFKQYSTTRRNPSAGGQASMKSKNISAPQVLMYLKGIKFPVTKSELIYTAKRNGAPENILVVIRLMKGLSFNRLLDVSISFGDFKLSQKEES